MSDRYIIHNWMYPSIFWPSGGYRAMTQLRDEIRARGFDCSFEYDEPADPNAIYLYVEVCYEQSLRCPSPRKAYFFGNKEANPRIPQDVLSFVWTKSIRDSHLLNVNIYEMDIWQPSKKKTSNVVYWIGKGQEDLSLLPDGAIEITRDRFTDRQELANLIAEADHLISFDPFTAVVQEALLVNTPVLIHNLGNHASQPKWTKEEVLSTGWADNVYKYGIAWSPDELPEARENVHKARAQYEEIMKTFPATVDNFIKVTQEYTW